MPIYRLDDRIKLHTLSGKENEKEDVVKKSINTANAILRRQERRNISSSYQTINNYLSQYKDEIQISKEGRLISQVIKIKNYINSLRDVREEKLRLGMVLMNEINNNEDNISTKILTRVVENLFPIFSKNEKAQ